MVKKSDVCILLTGCIAPPKDVHSLKVKDYCVRKQQYLEALEFYIRKSNVNKIVFCENSNFKEICELKKIALENGKVFEWLSFQGDEQKTIEKGKGYGEGEILKFACENSKLMQECACMVKITGRLKIKNINAILRMIHCKDNYINIYTDKQGRYFADTRCFIIKIFDFERDLIHEFHRVDDRQGKTYERCVAKKIIEGRIQYKKFPTYIEYEGISGSTGLIYGLNPKEKMHLFLKFFFEHKVRGNKPYETMEPYYIGSFLDKDKWENDFSRISGKRIAIYGAGEMGERLYRWCVKYCNVVMWADQNYKSIRRRYGKKIESPAKLKLKRLDYIVVAIMNIELFKSISNLLKEQKVGVELLWFDGNSIDYAVKMVKNNGEQS